MTRAAPRTHFHSSQLIRVLADLALLDAPGSGQAFAEKLGQWVDFNHAIVLSGVLKAGTDGPPDAPATQQAVAHTAVADAFARVRSGLVDAIAKSCSPGVGKIRNPLPEPKLDLPLDLAAAYAPYRRFLLAHQREMDASLPTLRAQVREVLAKASPALRQLAALDAALDGVLVQRESSLLATLPALLKKRFEQLFTQHQQRLLATGQADNPALWPRAGGWLARFYSEMQTLLLAELDLRLQPTLGLMEALNHGITQHQ